MESILTSTKDKLGVAESYTVFDDQIIDHINSAFSRLFTLGVGPAGVFSITDDVDEWVDVELPPDQLNMVKTFIALYVRMLFDPPQTSFLQKIMQDQIAQHEWLLCSMADAVAHPLSEDAV
jgi:hypothetical protein